MSDEWVPDEDVDLTAEPGTEEGDRAQDRIMYDGATEAATETAGPTPDPGANEDDSAGP